MVPNDIMNTQVNVRISQNLLKKAENYSKKNGYTNVQELIRESIREKIDPELTPSEHYLLTRIVDAVQKNKLKFGTEKELFEILGGKK